MRRDARLDPRTLASGVANGGVCAYGHRDSGRGSTQTQCAVIPMMAFGSVTDPVTATLLTVGRS
jgi:hypothetical protein